MNSGSKKKVATSGAKRWSGKPDWMAIGVAVLIAIGAVWWFTSDSDETAQHVDKSQYVIDHPPALAVAGAPVTQTDGDLFEKLKREAGIEYQTREAIEDQLRQLEGVFVTEFTGGKSIQDSAPEFLSDSFRGTGIDRESFESRMEGEQLSISRWRKSESAPEFQGSANVLSRMASNIFAPWKDCENFRIKLKVYSATVTPEKRSALVLANVYGDIDPRQGRQATSLWKLEFNANEQRTNPLLKSVSVLAQEEVVTQIAEGQLFQDCTQSILQRCDCLPEQLAYGLDQWARRIPGMDILGEHGVAVGDINGDGLDDIYVCQPHGLPNLLLVQNPDGTVDDVSQKARLDVLDKSHAALMIDLDNDRDQDLVISTDQNLLLFSNTGKAVFQLEHQLPIGRSTQSISAADFDQDGDLDLFLCKFQAVRQRDDLVVLPENFSTADDGGRNVLLRNDGGWQFVDATESSGITKDNSNFSRSAIWTDFDIDGDQDLCVVNEFSATQIYENQEGWLADVTDKTQAGSVARQRSISCGDFNQDGRVDLFVATDAPFDATRLLGTGRSSSETPDLRKVFTGDSRIHYATDGELSQSQFFLRAPIFATESAYGSAAADLNNDGFDDLVITNGMLTRLAKRQVDSFLFDRLFEDRPNDGSPALPKSTPEIARVIRETTDLCRAGYSLSGNQRNQCYLSIGQIGFANCSAVSGIDFPDDGRAVAATDWDNDGDVDLVLSSRNGPQLRILRNQLPAANDYLHVDLVGTQSNTDAIGSRVEVFLQGRDTPLVKTLTAGSGNLAQSTKRIMFGLGKEAEIEKLAVVWPDGIRTQYTGLTANRRYRIVEGEADAAEQNTERFELRLAARTLNGNQNLPSVQRSVFYPPLAIPSLTIVEPDGCTYPVFHSATKRATVVVFADDKVASKNLFDKIAEQADEYLDNELDCVALLIDPANATGATEMAFARTAMRESTFPFRWGTASAGTREKLELWLGHCFANQQLPPLPFAIMFDQNTKARLFYPADTINATHFIPDTALCRGDGGELWKSTGPFPGKWIARYRYPAYDRLTIRLAELGFSEDATRLHKHGARFRAYEFGQQGTEFASAGSLLMAEKFFKEAIKTDPNSVMSLLGLADLLLEQTKFVSEEEGGKRVEMQSQATAYYKLAATIDPTNPDALIGRANILIGENRIDDAIEYLKSYSQTQPDRYEIKAMIGRLHFQQGNTDEAAKWLVGAFNKRPNLPFVAGDLGFLYLTVGEHKQALKFLNLAHRLNRSDQNIVRLLAEANFLTGHYEQAVEQCESVLKQDPNQQRVQNMLAWLLATAPYEKIRDAKRALELIKPAVAISGDTSPLTMEIYAACCAENGQFDKATDSQTEAIDLIRETVGPERYTDKQKKALSSRLELYVRKKPYRMSDAADTPLGLPGQQESKN